MSYSYRLLIVAQSSVCFMVLLPLFIVTQTSLQPMHWWILSVSICGGFALAYLAIRSFSGCYSDTAALHRDLMVCSGILTVFAAVSVLWTGTYRIPAIRLDRTEYSPDYQVTALADSDPEFLIPIKSITNNNKIGIAGCCLGIGFGIFVATAKGPFSQERLFGLAGVCGVIGFLIAEQLLAVLLVSVCLAVLFVVIRFGGPQLQLHLAKRTPPLTPKQQNLQKLEIAYREMQGNSTIAPHLKHEQLKRLRADIRALGGRV